MTAPPTAAAISNALTAAAQAEYDATVVYPIVGATLRSPQSRQRAQLYYDLHREQLAVVTTWLSDRGATAPTLVRPAEPKSMESDRAVADFLATVEESVAARYADVVAATTGSMRRAAAVALQNTAVHEAHWRGTPMPFPGLVGRF